MVINRRFVLGVDLDGVCADFYRGLRPIAAEWLGVDVSTVPERVSWVYQSGNRQGPGGLRSTASFAVTQRDLFRILPPMAGAPAALRRLSSADVRIRIITHPFFIKVFHQVAARQQIEWLDYHDFPYWDLCFMQEKAAVGADLYIEDSPTNVEQLRDESLTRSYLRIQLTNTFRRHELISGLRLSTLF